MSNTFQASKLDFQETLKKKTKKPKIHCIRNLRKIAGKVVGSILLHYNLVVVLSVMVQ